MYVCHSWRVLYFGLWMEGVDCEGFAWLELKGVTLRGGRLV